MDVCDRAAAYQNKNNLEAIARHRRRMNAGGTINTICIDCGNKIPASRRRAAAKAKIPCPRCIECQTRIEGNG